eukprot:TRINITY_DN6479_c0_g1_i4.p2 TRINITY_DN6479_c0_g1~~TRINITY_DN6479_c0_g1_i4.p2  ORF type:complete len:255 (-),score=61.10 TRINITY_DN6479_c0_g1_i4:1393-2157(-)
MKGLVKCHGLQNPGIVKVFKEEIKGNIGEFTKDELKNLGFLQLRSEFLEEKYIGCFILKEIHKNVTEEDFKHIESFFDQGHVNNWAMCDGMCSYFLKNWSKGNEERTKLISKWREDANIWKKRASCVAFITNGRHLDGSHNFVGFTDLMFENCRVVLHCRERFPQLGAGWLLRELSVGDRPRAIKFIEDNYNLFIREGLRYAIEKLPTPEQKRLLAFQKQSELEVEVKKTTRKRRADDSIDVRPRAKRAKTNII